MDERLEMTIVHYAAMVLEWLDIDAKKHKTPRPQLVQKFVDALWVNEQIKAQED